MDLDLVSVVIPTFNRFNFLLNTIKSIKEQTYKNIEIIVVNDGSTQKEYDEFPWKDNDINIINLTINTKKIFGFANISYVRNKGIESSKGKYIAFCDDDDIWLPSKIELQLKHIKLSGCKMSCTDGLIGNGIYNTNSHYKKYIQEHFYDTIKKIHIHKKSMFLSRGIPNIWNYNFLKIHNCVVTSSVLVEKDLLNKVNNFSNIKPPGEDYHCWLKLLQNTNIVFLYDACFYYDNSHGSGSKY